MNKENRYYKDIRLYTNIINHLVYLTTKDEYGKIRSRGIETYGHLAEELNNEGIVPDRGFWTENSMKLFFPRIKKRYPDECYYDDCDLEFIKRSSWEYQSYTRYEEVIDSPHRIKIQSEENYNKTAPVYTYIRTKHEVWKEHDVEDIIKKEIKVIKKYKKTKCRTRINKS